MNNWFECKVTYTGIDEHSGKEKKKNDVYMFDAISYTEAESLLTREMEKMMSEDFKSSIKKARITDVFAYEDGDYWFKCKVFIIDIDDKTGKEKPTTNYMYINADDVRQAFDRLEEKLSSVIAPWEVHTIARTTVLEFFEYIEDNEEETELPSNLKKLTELLNDAETQTK